MKQKTAIILIVFFSITVFLTLNRHSKSGVENYHSEIWADKAGYYIYLPLYFIYDFDIEKMPNEIDRRTGYGFFVKDGKIITKYSYGVALMQSPFFVITHFLSKYLGYNNDGFSAPYHKLIDLAAVTYSFFGLIFLCFFLRRYVGLPTAIVSTIVLYLGTNLFYYSIFDTGMSHTYSFFLFACFLFLSPFLIQNSSPIYFMLFGLIAGLIVAVRPINILFFPSFFLFNNISIAALKQNLKSYILIFVPFIAVLIPQFLYWKYAFDNYFQYAYQHESFSNWFQPNFLLIWFSTNNGLFIYNPIFLLIIFGIIYLYKKHKFRSVAYMFYFMLISYVIASWHDWTYGCSYGCRPYTEYYAIFALPLAFFIKELNRKSIHSMVVIVFLVITILYNQKLIFTYDGCWYAGNWDWGALLQILLASPK